MLGDWRGGEVPTTYLQPEKRYKSTCYGRGTKQVDISGGSCIMVFMRYGIGLNRATGDGNGIVCFV